MRLPTSLGLVSALALAVAGALADDRAPTATPIKHVVVIFQENVSFDHYFGTYPIALNLSGETQFMASPRIPKVNNLVNPLDVNHNFRPLAGVDLLNNNPNSNPTNPAAPNNSKINGTGASNPFRLSPSQALTADQGHNEGPEESAYNNGRMDGFPAFVGTAGPSPAGIGSKALVMGYYDGNTVHRAVELRPAFRVERQQLHHSVRPFDAWRAQPDLGPEQRLRCHAECSR